VAQAGYCKIEVEPDSAPEEIDSVKDARSAAEAVQGPYCGRVWP